MGSCPYIGRGNQVWADVNNNGSKMPAEAGISNVLVILHYFNGSTCVAVDSQYTNATGGYLFDSLIAGNLVEIAAINLAPGGPLAGYAAAVAMERII
ncbi:MAG: hypothetical protein IPO25_22845 [Saprospiraceae bacterium]|nr:hypothetical protein [Saprospiraceae bacterium]